jgi:hypothetical protein
MQNRAYRTGPGHEGGLVVAGVDGDDDAVTVPSVPFYPQTGEGQVLAIGAVAVTSAAMTLNREHCIWAEQNCWIRVGAGAAANDFPLPAGAVFVYTPRTTGVGGDDTISVIQMAALGGNLYIGQSEAT